MSDGRPLDCARWPDRSLGRDRPPHVSRIKGTTGINEARPNSAGNFRSLLVRASVCRSDATQA
jgi:hypothetical protein